MKKLMTVAALAAVTLTTHTAAFAQAARTPAAVVVLVDTDRIYRECTACRAAQTQLQTLGTQLQQFQQQLAQPIQTEAQAIQTAAQAAERQPAGAARTAAENALRTRAQALQTRQDQANQQLQARQQNIQSTQAHVLQQINERLRPIINQVMAAHGANLAVDMGSTITSTPALDVTAEVLASLNTALPSVSVTPLPAQTAPANPNQGR